MKKFAKILIAIVLSTVLLFGFSTNAFAATHSKTKNGGGTFSITSNTGWNTELFGNKYRTKIQISVPKNNYGYYFSKNGQCRLQVKIEKKNGSKWTVVDNGTWCTNSSGVISSKNPNAVNSLTTTNTWVLPGKGVQYRVIITPKGNGIVDTSKVPVTVKIVSYGNITG